MANKSTNVLLGGFVIGAVAIVVSVFLLLAGNGYNKSAQKIVMVFDSSVKGLTVGAPVALRGVNIGEVTSIRALLHNDDKLDLVMEVEAILQKGRVTRQYQDAESMNQELIASGLRAQLNTQSLLTGLLYIQLDFFPDTEATLRAPESELLEVPTIPSRIEMLFEDIGRLDLPRLVSDLQRTALAIRRFSENEDFQTLPTTINESLARTVAIAEETQALLARLEPKVDQTLSGTASAARTLETQLPLIADNINVSLRQLDATLVTIEGTGNSIENLLDPDAPLIYGLNRTLADLTRASRAISSLARSVEEQPQSLILGRPEKTQ